LGSAIVAYSLDRWILALLRIGTPTPPLNPLPGLALGLTTLYGPRALLGVLLGLGWSAQQQGLPAIVLVGNLLGTAVMTRLGDRFLRGLNVSPRLPQVRDVLLLILFGALLPSSLNATINSLSNSLGKVVPLAELGNYWWSLWRSDSLGILTVAPMVWAALIDFPRPITQWRRGWSPQGLALGLWLFAVLLSAGITLVGHGPTLSWLDYLPFFCLAWAVARFGQRGSILTGFLMVSLAAWYTFQGQGTFLERSGNLSQGLVSFQSWSAVILAIALVMGAALQERSPGELGWSRMPISRSESSTPLTSSADRLLNEFSQRIRQSLAIDEILQHTVDEVRQLLGADRVCIWQTAASGEGFVRSESVGPAVRSMRSLTIPVEVVAQMQAQYASQRLQVRDDVRAADLPPMVKQVNELYDVRSTLTTSLVREQEVYGLLTIYQCDHRRVWQPQEIELLERLAPQIELAIHQGNLYTDLQTQTQTMEAEIRDQSEQLRASIAAGLDRDQLQRQLIHAVNHDLRTPMLGMLMVLQKLAMQSGDQVLLPKTLLDRMLESHTRQLDLMQSLLEDYADRPDPRFQPNPEPISLHSLVAHTLNQLQSVLVQHQPSLENQISLDLPDIQGDPVYLERVLENLINNAIQHNPPETPIILRATHQPDLGQVLVEVVDRGRGLSREQQQALFSRPYPRCQFDRRLTGLGLGLFLCHQIIQAHQGEIGVESDGSTGAIFWFTLPLAADTAIRSANPTATENL
jgi:signal transduction histidine kinase/integral membrane sensor domain MASE1